MKILCVCFFILDYDSMCSEMDFTPEKSFSSNYKNSQLLLVVGNTASLVICKEDCPSDDQNQRDGGARIFANDHLDDQASWAEIRTRPATYREDPQYKISAQTDQRFRR